MTNKLPDLKVRWIDRGSYPTRQPNPDYPTGIDVDMSGGEPSCFTTLPYPAQRIGFYVISCKRCKTNAVVTTAGRADDPRSVSLRCKVGAQRNE